MPQLTLSVASSAANQSLTALALTDWMAVHNPIPAVDWKSGAGNTIGISRYGGGGDATTVALARTISWTDGTNFGTGSISDGVLNGGGANTGYELTFPATTALRQAQIYLGGYSSTVKVTAIISDASTSNQIDTTLSGVSVTFVLGVATVIYQASGTATLTVRVESQSGLSSPAVLVQGAAWGAYTAAAPVLSAPTGAATGNTTANAGATIDTVSSSGTRIMYALPRIGGSAASAATIKSTGTQLAVTSNGAKSVPLTGLTNGASYSADIVYSDATLGDSNVVTATWTQTAAPVLSSPTNTPGSTTALIGATTTVSSGTAYFLARVGGSAASAATIIATGQTATVSTTTPSKTVTGLTASTANNYVDVVQVSGVTTSNVVSAGPFTTTTGSSATSITMTGPSSGTVSVASTNFTIGADGTISGTIIVTPSDSGAGGTFTPSTVSISSGSPTGTFVYTPVSIGTKTISVTNNGSLTNPSNISYVVTAGATRTVTLSLTTDGTNPAANLTGLKWAFFDQVNPGLFTAPTASGTSGTTNSSGIFTVNVTGTTLSAGQIGWLLISDSDGTVSQAPPGKAFSAPVVIS